MRKITIITLVLFFTLGSFLYAQSGKKNIGLAFELGAGRLLTISADYNRIGLFAGFDVGDMTINNKDYSSYLIGFGANYNINLLKEGNILLNLRPNLGINIVGIDEYSATGYEISLHFQAGYKNFYGILAPIYLLTSKDNAFLFQIGVGYRLNLQ